MICARSFIAHVIAVVFALISAVPAQAQGEPLRPYIGVQLQNVEITVGGRTMVGAKIVSVISGAPAAAVGLKPDDVIVRVSGANSVWIDLESEDPAKMLAGVVRQEGIGGGLRLAVVRDGREMTTEIRVAAAPAADLAAGTIASTPADMPAGAVSPTADAAMPAAGPSGRDLLP